MNLKDMKHSIQQLKEWLTQPKVPTKIVLTEYKS